MTQPYPLDLNTEFSPSAQGTSFLGHGENRELATWELKYLRMNGLTGQQVAHIAAAVKPRKCVPHFHG